MSATVLEDRCEIKSIRPGITSAVESAQILDLSAHPRQTAEGVKSPETKTSDLRAVFIGQARLLALRAERGLRLDWRSFWNLLRVFLALSRGEGSHD